MSAAPQSTNTDIPIEIALYGLTPEALELIATEYGGTIPTIGALDMPVIKVRFSRADAHTLGMTGDDCAEAFKAAISSFLLPPSEQI